MANDIILNLTTNEYLDSFTNEELWQQAAKEKLVEMLKKNSKEAYKYKQEHNDHNNKKIIYSAHNAIFISGERGAGKTVFLRNAENIWLNACIDDDNISKSDIYFLEIIDPTLLIKQDEFANVIIAQLYNAVEERLKSSSKDQCQCNEFYTSLQELANALGKTKEFNDYTGIDKILKYSSGVQIQHSFHDFVEKCIKILNCKAIVIPIDDVDMALDKAFEVLDDVRRLLSCPYIITIISGSLHLYSHMMHVHFQKLAAPIGFIDDDTLKHGRETAQSLAEAYLTKVFPNHQRLSLLPIDDLLPKLQIIEKEQDKGITFFKYEKDLQGYFYYLCNGEAGSTKWPKPKNAREVTQLIRSLPPSIFNQEKLEEYLWSTFQSWAEQKQDGVAYSNAVSYQQVIDHNMNHLFRIEQLLAFSPKQQVDIKFSGSKKNFFKEQLEAIKELSGKGEENNKILNSVFNEDSLVMRSMPPLEFLVGNLFLNRNAIETDENNILKRIYTHCDYYGKSSQQFHNIYFSRAFEILILSILDVTSKEKKINWDEQLRFILNRPPFYSIHAMNPTKFVDDEDMSDGEDFRTNDEESNEGKDSNDSNDSNESNDSKDSNLSKKKTFPEQIDDWCEMYEKDLKELQTKNLIPLLHAVFNKVFTQLHIIRKKSFKLNEDEHLSDIAKRFEYLVINAFASFMKEDGIISHANPALTADVSTISNEENFKKRDRVLTKNIEGLVIFDSKKEVKNDRIASLLLSAIWNHPLFKNNNVSSPIFKIGSRQQIYTFNSIKSNVMKRYKNFSVDTLNDWVKVQKRPTLEKMLDGLRLDDLFWNYENEEEILKMNKREEFPRLYQIIYYHIQDVNKKK
ncbi:antiviral RADAR system adenosine triphosphatase RdrA [Gilliamella apicola]|uniref:antiviral RADAR system adenosine triphosphatase RdrA n=1 Tax=Gilliamella apicola TaxID=1196095 RepID=UPI00398873FE